MLKRVKLLTLLCSVCLLMTGCALWDAGSARIRDGVIHLSDELFSQNTITMVVLVTNTPTSTVTPTPSVTPTPTRTVTPTATVHAMNYIAPTFQSLSTAELPLSYNDEISDVSDITVPDDTVLDPGQLFIKSWRLTNNGANTWEEGTKLMMSADYDMDMPSVVKAIFVKPNDWINMTPGGWGQRIYNVAPGTEVDMAVILKAPTEPGSYTIHFRLVTTSGEIITTPFWMRFSVSRPTDTPTPVPPTNTPDPAEGSSGSAVGTPIAVAVDSDPYDWSGRWMVREPFHDGGIIPANAWLEQDGEDLIGLIYNSDGDPIIIRGAVSTNGRSFNGEIYYPWQNQTTAVSWRMQMTRGQFYAITPLGTLDESAVCGARGSYNFPASCAMPAGS